MLLEMATRARRSRKRKYKRSPVFRSAYLQFAVMLFDFKTFIFRRSARIVAKTMLYDVSLFHYQCFSIY